MKTFTDIIKGLTAYTHPPTTILQVKRKEGHLIIQPVYGQEIPSYAFVFKVVLKNKEEIQNHKRYYKKYSSNEYSIRSNKAETLAIKTIIHYMHPESMVILKEALSIYFDLFKDNILEKINKQ